MGLFLDGPDEFGKALLAGRALLASDVMELDGSRRIVVQSPRRIPAIEMLDANSSILPAKKVDRDRRTAKNPPIAH